MSKLSTLTSRGRFMGAAAALLAVSAFSSLAPTMASAELVQNRSLALTSSAMGTAGTTTLAGSATNGQKVGYTFTFDAATTANMGSWSVMFCTTAFGYFNTTGARPVGSGNSGTGESAPCATPTGFTAVAAADPTVTVEGTLNAGWTTTVDANRPNVILITNASPAALTAGDTVVINFPASASEYITNPSVASNYNNLGTGFENTFFGHMDTYSDSNYATKVDDGTVTSATTENIAITARVQETLKFSVGTTAAAPTTACVPLTGPNTLTLGDTVNGALSTAQAYDATSYFRIATNAISGTDINYAGQTLKSGAREIAAIGLIPAQNVAGTEQFGLAIDGGAAGTTVGSTGDLIPVADYANGAGTLSVANGTPGNAEFLFDTDSDGAPVTLASVTNDLIDCDTGAVRYVANINQNTPAGIYRTSINYIAVPRY